LCPYDLASDTGIVRHGGAAQSQWHPLLHYFFQKKLKMGQEQIAPYAQLCNSPVWDKFA
jgi:hypothetical protein